MSSKYRIIFIITFLLFLLSMGLSLVNYIVTLNSTQKHLEKASLPLSTDNIYSEIQTHLIEPNLVASMMAQDTFLKDWLIHEEDNEEKIRAYLESIKNKYGMRTVFLASQNTQNYYLARGLVEKMEKTNPTNAWYYKFRNNSVAHEVNIDYNKNIDNSMFMFINHKIFDDKFHLLGVTGVGLKISYVDDMLKRFRQEYKFKVCFVNQKGDIILFERGINKLTTLKDNSALYKHKNNLLGSKNHTTRYSDENGSDYLVHSKYIPELDLYLLVEAKVSDFTSDVRKTFYMNLVLSLLVTIMIVIIIVKMINTSNFQLEKLANYDELTNLPNRRVFNEKLKQLLLLHGRKTVDISIIFFDLDDFKKINDNYGHNIGDKVLIRVSQIIRENIRETDLCGRWGGEEFIAAFVNSSLEDAQIKAQKLRVSIENDKELKSLVGSGVTASFGLTEAREKDSVESVLKRVDKALYEAKDSGKNRIVLS